MIRYEGQRLMQSVELATADLPSFLRSEWHKYNTNKTGRESSGLELPFGFYFLGVAVGMRVMVFVTQGVGDGTGLGW